MEKCQGHMIADGAVNRTSKEDGKVYRLRRCGECFHLFKTVEKTLDSLASEKAGIENKLRILRAELAFYKTVVDRVKALYADIEMIKDDIREEYEVGGNDGE